MAHKYVMFKKRRSEWVDKRWKIREFTDGPVRVMAVADGYAMVRRKGCVPFVISQKDLIQPPAQERVE